MGLHSEVLCLHSRALHLVGLPALQRPCRLMATYSSGVLCAGSPCGFTVRPSGPGCWGRRWRSSLTGRTDYIQHLGSALWLLSPCSIPHRIYRQAQSLLRFLPWSSISAKGGIEYSRTMWPPARQPRRAPPRHGGRRLPGHLTAAVLCRGTGGHLPGREARSSCRPVPSGFGSRATWACPVSPGTQQSAGKRSKT